MSAAFGYVAVRGFGAQEALPESVRDIRREGPWVTGEFNLSDSRNVVLAIRAFRVGDRDRAGAVGTVEGSSWAQLTLFGAANVVLVLNVERAPVHEGEPVAAAWQDVNAAVAWARAQGVPDVDPHALAPLLENQHIFPELALDELLRRLGLPSASGSDGGRFGEMVGEPYDAVLRMPDGRKVNYKDLRYVIGEGLDFHGVWDKMRPATPVSRHVHDGFGFSEARKSWARLMNALPRDQWLAD